MIAVLNCQDQQYLGTVVTNIFYNWTSRACVCICMRAHACI